jgi:hypothetical protein
MLAAAETGFTFDFEYYWDPDTSSTLDFVVGVEKGFVKTSGKQLSHAGFSRTHQSNQKNIVRDCAGRMALRIIEDPAYHERDFSGNQVFEWAY